MPVLWNPPVDLASVERDHAVCRGLGEAVPCSDRVAPKPGWEAMARVIDAVEFAHHVALGILDAHDGLRGQGLPWPPLPGWVVKASLVAAPP